MCVSQASDSVLFEKLQPLALAPRPSCRHGTACYRGSQHRLEVAHPPDQDYEAPSAGGAALVSKPKASAPPPQYMPKPVPPAAAAEKEEHEVMITLDDNGHGEMHSSDAPPDTYANYKVFCRHASPPLSCHFLSSFPVLPSALSTSE